MTSELLQIALAVVGAFGVFILNDLKKSVEKATESVSELNTKVSVIIEKSERHDKEIDILKANDTILKEKIGEFGFELSQICKLSIEGCPQKQGKK